MVFYKHRSLEGVVRERTVKNRHIISFLRVIKDINANIRIKRALRNSIILLTLPFA